MSQELYVALVNFQANCPPIDKDSEVAVKTQTGSYKFAYATFGNIVQTIKPALTKAGLGYTFVLNEASFSCRIFHVSGAYTDTSIPMPKMRDKMQENGSIFTYLKRYSLVLALGLDTDADEDGNTADGNAVEFIKGPKTHVADVEKFTQTGDLKRYRVPVGKFKDKFLAEIDHGDLENYIMWLHNSSREQNKPLTGKVLEFAKIAEAYLNGAQSQV